jgi:signal transduction histidine kinase
VLNNLLSNAIKYSPRGGVVRVELTTAPDAAWVAVTDSGIGIPAEELESIFEPFRRSSTTRDAIPGVGLGLAVGRRIIEAHGGHIEVQSQLGVGTTFRVRLPREPPLSGKA